MIFNPTGRTKIWKKRLAEAVDSDVKQEEERKSPRCCFFFFCSCLLKWRNLNFFPYSLIFSYIKQMDSMLPCSGIDHRGRQNVVRTSVTYSAARGVF